MATSVAEIQAGLENACQALKGAVTGYQQTIKALENQILGNEANLNKLQAQTNPDQDTIDQINQITQMLKSLRGQLATQQDGLIAAQDDYEANCPPSPPAQSKSK